MTQSEYADHRNCKPRTVRRAIAAGAVPVTQPGSRGRVLVDEADRLWAPGKVKTARPSKAGRRGAQAAARARDKNPGGGSIADPDDTSADRDPDDLTGDSLDEELTRVKIRQGRIKAARDAIELERERKENARLADIRADATKAATEIRTRFRSLGSSLGLRLQCQCHSAAEVEAIVAEEVNAILTVLNRTRFAPREDAAP